MKNQIKIQDIKFADGTMQSYETVKVARHFGKDVFALNYEDEIHFAIKGQGEYLVMTLFSWTKNTSKWYDKAEAILKKYYQYKVEISGMLQMFKMTENEFDNRFGEREEGYNFWVISKTAI